MNAKVFSASVAIALFLPAPALASDPGLAPGTVQTLAGPTYCPGDSVRDDSTASVRSLAVAPDGAMFFDTGAARDGLIGRVLADGTSTVIPAGAARGADPVAGKGAFDQPPGAGRLAADGQGGVFVAAGAKILQIDRSGALAAVIGDPDASPGKPGNQSGGDGGPVSQARFLSARSLATDEAGNLYVADQIDPRSPAVRIRFINRSAAPVTFFPGTEHSIVVAPGSIDTIAGRRGAGNAGDKGPALQATIAGAPPSMSIAAGRLYLGLYLAEGVKKPATSVVRMVNLGGDPISAHGVAIAPGTIDRVAGRGPEGFGGDKGSALSAGFSFLPGIAADTKGSLYLADERHHRVRKVDPQGRIASIAGVGGTGLNDGGFNGNDKIAVGAGLNHPYDVKVGPAGLYISDQFNRQVRTVDDLGVIRAAPGAGLAASAKCLPAGKKGAQPVTPSAGEPVSVATNAGGDIFFSLKGRGQIMKLSAAGRITPIAGKAAPSRCSARCPTFSGDGGPAKKALLSSPSALVVDSRGNIYFSDGENHRVRFINRGGQTVKANGVTVRPSAIRTILGNGVSGLEGDGGPATKAHFSGADSMAVDRGGALYVVERLGKKVRKVDSTGVLSTLAGKGAPPPRDQCCPSPAAVAADAGGNVYVSNVDSERTHGPKVWLINQGKAAVTVRGQQIPPGGVQPVAGSGSFGFGGDGGRATDAELSSPTRLVLDRFGALFIAEDGNRFDAGFAGDVRRVDPGGIITLLAGNGIGGFNGDGQKSRLTSLNPSAIVVSTVCGDVIIADGINGRIRRILSDAPCRRP